MIHADTEMEQISDQRQKLLASGGDSLPRTLSSRSINSTDNVLAFICELRPKKDHQLKHNQETVQVQLPSRCNVHQLRLRICIQAQEQNSLLDPFSLLDPEQYQLLYNKGGEWYEIHDDHQVLHTLNAEWQCDANGKKMARIVLAPLPEVTEEAKRFHQLLTYLIGYDLSAGASNRLGELNFARRKFAAPRKEELQRRDTRAYALEPWVTSSPLVKEQQSLLSCDLLVTLYYNDKNFNFKVDINDFPCDLIETFIQKMFDSDFALEYTVANLTLKVCGREEFLSGDYPLSNFLWVRHCLKTMQGLHLSVLPIASLEEDTLRPEDWPLVDGFTGLPSSHEELALSNKELDDIMMISLMDCDRTLRVKLVGLDIPQLPSKAPQYIQVEASVLYGNKVLSSVCSLSKPFSDEVLWNEWLEFDLLLKNLPYGAKLSLTVNATTPDSNAAVESKPPSAEVKTPDYQKGKGKVLFFVNLLLIDHRSILSQGLHTLYMWPFPEHDEEALTYEADKLSSATNPDQTNSMAITFLLDRYSFPVVLPNSYNSPGICASSGALYRDNTDEVFQQSSSDQRSPGSGNEEASQFSSKETLDRGSLRRFREESVHYGSNLPQFLRKVNWLNSNAVQDIHWLLSNWDPEDLEVPIALELLSVDFADKMVRRLAVQKLETLSNEEVQRYLLQLVQTLKVEPYHDSYLARFLIQRALRSKRIGHFFFWYLRSEVSGFPYFQQRLAVVLEAYLLGCGQAMLTSFLQQVQLVECLHKVAVDIKKLFPEKTDLTANAAQQLQDMLRSCNLPSEFQVPYDPRVRAGAIMLDRCKVMASKKKPLWLEFSSPASQGPSGPPVGMIFKHGDDLRQDMLVIQTLILMDSVWQEKSLNLNLVPYGCISTGHNIGLIEIVRDAVTIAAVQRSRGGNTGAFKNDALLEWLKGRSQLQEIHYQAMERFVTSCAGYCVATYVLGIGDRHNDNIMITEQGNLFHIDFGHILGNTKRFLGVNRERAPFVLTPDFLYVMGRKSMPKKSSLYFQRFKKTCIEAYLALRTHTRLLVTLFSLMLLTGIPELSCAQDMQYLRQALQDNQNEEVACDHFLQQIDQCEQLGWTVQANWWIHMVAGIK
ncbi:phosphatidylinositol 4,5-bisphosphate 3-kinase catalytic subunit gamma isoform isoform X1 [Brienomyrus brachyistius]|uniref:phosphatidylinositol 4,5-bisphosphate 3-kinase catalytic subunit gamma isoform isoform X1 n=2 Tax=Brienomyrus brachyistius TaxID=42636 RepID=UPI0020B2369C|nr:phosphatidylinositol 4,5-bisphosphate 3-kinase catalytic subunit gamma isoform isoform X1 [Brienomyrus brachyistius]